MTAPADLRVQLRSLPATALIDICAALRPAAHGAALAAGADPVGRGRPPRSLARRHQQLTTEIVDLDRLLTTSSR